MPVYDYRVGQGERLVEAAHPMNASPTTWAELRRVADLPDDGTPDDEPVQKILTTGGIMSSSGNKTALPPCMGGNSMGGCGGGMCGA